MLYRYKSEDPCFPSITFEDDRLEIYGDSYMENPHIFYLPLLNTLKNIIEDKHKIEIDYKINYANTSSSKCLFQIMEAAVEYSKKDYDIILNWFYQKYDEDIYELIETFESDLKYKINKYDY